jgi:dTDP-4-dehydrorhamnose 3,5-epimerase
VGFRFQPLEIPAVLLVEAVPHADRRGYFVERYRESEFRAHGIDGPFVQDNESRSVRGVLRGLHYQDAPRPQAKLVMVLAGDIFDVAVDLRRGSPTYGRWVSERLGAGDHRMLYVPEGFAHGFCVLSEAATVLYKVNREHDPALDRGVAWNDPEIGIRWPVDEPILSARDASLPPLREAPHAFCYEGRP